MKNAIIVKIGAVVVLATSAFSQTKTKPSPMIEVPKGKPFTIETLESTGKFVERLRFEDGGNVFHNKRQILKNGQWVGPKLSAKPDPAFKGDQGPRGRRSDKQPSKQFIGTYKYVGGGSCSENCKANLRCIGTVHKGNYFSKCDTGGDIDYCLCIDMDAFLEDFRVNGG